MRYQRLPPDLETSRVHALAQQAPGRVYQVQQLLGGLHGHLDGRPERRRFPVPVPVDHRTEHSVVARDVQPARGGDSRERRVLVAKAGVHLRPVEAHVVGAW